MEERVTYQIMARGDYVGHHKTLEAAIEHAERLTCEDVTIHEVPEDCNNTPITDFPVVWQGKR